MTGAAAETIDSLGPIAITRFLRWPEYPAATGLVGFCRGAVAPPQKGAGAQRLRKF